MAHDSGMQMIQTLLIVTLLPTGPNIPVYYKGVPKIQYSLMVIFPLKAFKSAH